MSTLSPKGKPQIRVIKNDDGYSPTEGTWDWSDGDVDWSDGDVTWGGGDTVLNLIKPKLK